MSYQGAGAAVQDPPDRPWDEEEEKEKDKEPAEGKQTTSLRLIH
jgi:hypothetical protein